MTKLLRQFGDQVWSNGLTSSFYRERLFRCLGSLSPSSFLRSGRSVDVVPGRRHMNTATHPSEEPSAAPPAPAPAAIPRWMLLSRDIKTSPRDSSDVADGKTAVPSRCSTGQPFRVSLGLVAPPSSSFLHHDWTGVSDEENAAMRRQSRGSVIAAHGDSVLCTIDRESRSSTFDHFIYTAAGAGRPPSVSLLPVCCIPTMSDRFWRDLYSAGNNNNEYARAYNNNNRSSSSRRFSAEDTGILRCGDGDGELLVAQLERAVPIVDTPAAVVHDELLRWSFCANGRAVVPVGSRFLCWVNYNRSTLLVCDMAEEDLKLRYLKLPVEPCVDDDEPKPFSDDEEEEVPELRRSMGGEGADAVRLVSIEPRCCCGGHGTSTCARSRFAFKVTAWTMNLGTSTAGKTSPWVKAGELDSDEIWALPGYEGLPRTPLERPVVSSDNPDIVCFIVRDEIRPGVLGWKASKVEVDMRKRVLLSAVPCDADTYPYYDRVVPVNLQGTK
ncbi:hypothetical protein BS78_05G081400 [Paspalum vaginatum]|nr:hypothetical protein BS78_05G081400 [Paspalum vaginatum]